MRKKLLTRTNAFLGAAIISLLGLSGCNKEPLVKYGSPDPPMPMYGIPTPEEVVETPQSPVND